MKRNNIIILLVIVAIFVAIFITSHFKTRNWEQTEGEIIRSYISRTYKKSSGLYQYKPVIEYKYKVDEIEYMGETISIINTSYKQKEKAQQVIDQLKKPNKKIIIYYNPKNPKESVIIK